MVPDSSSGAHKDTNHDAAKDSRIITWPTLPELPELTASTILCIGRRFYVHSPGTILKLGTDEDEAAMTAFAHDVLGSVVPHLDALVQVLSPPEIGILIAQQPGTPLAEVWPTLSTAQRTTVKSNLSALLLRMRAPPNHSFDYYGRPNEQPYVTLSEVGPNDTHSFCRTRAEWDASRVRALRSYAEDAELASDRMHALEKLQYETSPDSPLVNAPVLTHGDLSDRNILIDPATLEITGLLDWELANVAPAYFEYAAACLAGGHSPEWRQALLEVLRAVLRVECQRAAARSPSNGERAGASSFRETLAAWNALVDVERPAQGYSDECDWTFENKPETSPVGEEDE